MTARKQETALVIPLGRVKMRAFCALTHAALQEEGALDNRRYPVSERDRMALAAGDDGAVESVPV